MPLLSFAREYEENEGGNIDPPLIKLKKTSQADASEEGDRSRGSTPLGQGAGKRSTGAFSYTHPFDPPLIKLKKTFRLERLFQFGGEEGDRTLAPENPT